VVCLAGLKSLDALILELIYGQLHSLQDPSLGPTQRQVPQSEFVVH
jgi:hypothetical protein